MGRSGYSDEWEDDCSPNLYRATVKRAISGKRGQIFLQALAKEMDAMPEKILIDGELIDVQGNCCTIGVMFKARGIDVKDVDYGDPEQVGKLINIAPSMAAEIAYLNDDDFDLETKRKPGGIAGMSSETAEERWLRMRKWVAEKLGQQDGDGDAD